jgi:hypothetical protein
MESVSFETESTGGRVTTGSGVGVPGSKGKSGRSPPGKDCPKENKRYPPNPVMSRQIQHNARTTPATNAVVVVVFELSILYLYRKIFAHHNATK